MKKILCIILLACSTLSLFAWGVEGHCIVAQVAYENLDCSARKKVDKLLGKRGIVYQSSWADAIKSDTIYPESYDWHFQNLKAGMTHADIDYLYANNTAEGKHLFYALDSLINVLEENPNDLDALKFVVHFMGDMYQPMHMGHPEDKGGNKTQMRWFSQGSNLHSVWDSKIIGYTNYSWSEYAAYLIDQYSPQKKAITKKTELECLYDTYALQNAIYAYHELKDNNTYHYAYRFRKDLDVALYTAGIRLAMLLNRLY